MPGFNGKGPQGKGPMTGGGRGLCAGSMKPKTVEVQPDAGADQNIETPLMGLGRGGRPFGGGRGGCFGGRGGREMGAGRKRWR